MKVVAIGLGEPKHAAYFGPRLAPSATCLSRPTAEAHAAYGIGRAGADTLVQPGMYTAALKAASGGHMQGKATGDARVLSGTFLVDSSGTIRYAHYARFPGDDPEIRDLIQAAQAMLDEVKT